jgi:methylglutaconyl-CoA hydratase
VNALLEHIDPRGVATVTLNRLDRHNAFDDALIAGITATLRRLESDPAVRIVVLAAAGKSFSAGADLGWMRRMAGYSEAENISDAEKLAEMLHTLDRLKKPTVALVQGPAYGGGVGLVACCDVALAAERASFRLSEVRLGLTPATISPYVVNAIGARHARRYFVTAESFSAARAKEIGLVHEVVAEAALGETCETVIENLLQGAPGAQADAKDLVFLCEGRAIDAALGAETSRRIASRRGSPEGREGLAAFLEKRAPAWRAETPKPPR